MRDWEIKEKMKFAGLIKELETLNQQYAGKQVMHFKTGMVYRIKGVSVLNHNGISEFAVNYCPSRIDGSHDYEKLKHVRPAREFFDGRFDISEKG